MDMKDSQVGAACFWWHSLYCIDWPIQVSGPDYTQEQRISSCH